MDMQEPLVQPLAVARNRGYHEDVVIAVALASVQAWMNDADNPAWKQWLSGRFTKSVRRGTPAQIEAVMDQAAAIVTMGDVVALGFAPIRYSEMPEPLAKMQVAHFERPRENEDKFCYSTGPTPALWVNEDLGMSTGKTAAQVAHALMAWALQQESLDAWAASNYRFALWGGDREQFNDLKSQASIVIEDAGLTEIAAQTATVLVVD